jgi:hypothetical protein
MVGLKTIKISLNLVGNKGQDCPNIKIAINNQTKFDQPCIGNQQLKWDIPAEDHNTIVVTHYDKNNDTIVDSNGQIVSDRHCILTSIEINNLTFDLNFFSEHQLFFYTNSNEKIITNYFGKDGYFIFEFPYPLWKFWEVLQNTSKSPN